MNYIQLLIYSLIGAIIFCGLGIISTKYRGDTNDIKSISRDAISGALFLIFLQIFLPGFFPNITMNEVMDKVRIIGGGETDMDLQF
jgi:hypothetical protein